MNDLFPSSTGRLSGLVDLPFSKTTRTDSLIQVDPATLAPGPISLSTLFGNEHPVELEVGIGKGRFLLLAATSNPGTNYLGLEYARRFFLEALDRMGKRGLTNVRLFLTDAVPFITQNVPDAGISAVHVYFPDPWPKKRHHKRRFFRQAVLDQVARILKSGAPLKAVTDHPEYAQVIREEMGVRSDFLESEAEPRLWELPGMGDYTTLGVTNFEIKYRREGRPIYRFAWQRR